MLHIKRETGHPHRQTTRTPPRVNPSCTKQETDKVIDKEKRGGAPPAFDPAMVRGTALIRKIML